MLRGFQTDNLCDYEQLEIEVKNVVVCKIKLVSGKFSEIVLVIQVLVKKVLVIQG